MIKNIEIIKTERKSIAIEIKSDLRVIIRAPKGMSNRMINTFIAEKSDWIAEHLEIVKARIASEKGLPAFSPQEIKSMTAKAKKIIPERTEYFAKIMGTEYNRITIRHQSSRWGSCSSKNNLNFNCLLVLCPDEVRDYVIIHELCHLKEMNHSPKFWAQVARYCADYEVQKAWLRQNGSGLIKRLKND